MVIVSAGLKPGSTRIRLEKVRSSRPAPDQEHDRQRDLRHHEQASQLMMTAIGGASAALLPQRRLRFDAAGLPRGHEPEDERRDGGHHEREDQTREIETDRLGAA